MITTQRLLCGFQGIVIIGCFGSVTDFEFLIYVFAMLFYGIDVYLVRSRHFLIHKALGQQFQNDCFCGS